MPKIEFFYYADCPSHERALELLRQVMAEEKVDVPIEIIEVTSDEEAYRYNFWGSPTIRVNGVDIAPLPDDLPEPALTCRAYRRANGSISPLPPRELIAAALQPYSEMRLRSDWLSEASREYGVVSRNKDSEAGASFLTE